MTVQANPPLPDPVTGRMPAYSQVMQQNSNGQWVIMYDVQNVQTTSTTGTIAPLPGPGVPSVPDIETPITTFPEPGDPEIIYPEPTPFPIDPEPVPVDPGPVFGGGGRDNRDNMGPTGPGAVSIGGGWFDGETGQPYGKIATAAYNGLTGNIPGLGSISVVGKIVGALAKANMNNAIASMTDEARSAMFGSEIGKKTLSKMTVAERSKLKKSLQAKMTKKKKGLNVGFDVHPNYSYDENQRNMRDVSGEVDLDKSAGTDSNYGGTGSTVTGSRGPGGAAARQKGGPSGGTGSTGTGSTGTGSAGPGGAGGRQKGGPSGGTSPGSKSRDGGNPGGNSSGGGSGGSGGSGGCFVKGTTIQMADGTTKEITTIKVGEETRGGIVQARMEFMPQSIYNYQGVLVSGSHWVIEDNQFIEVEDSKHGVLTDKIEPVYTFKTSDNRIWINDIEFGDFETGSDDDWAPYFEQVKQDLNKKLRGEA